MQHWLPYDETRLYSLLGVTRGDVWRWLRDDTRNLAGLAALHGYPDPQVLARELVAAVARARCASRAAGACCSRARCGR